MDRFEETETPTETFGGPRRADPERARRVEEVFQVQFPQAIHGYDREAVDRYLEQVRALVSELEASSSSPDIAVQRAIDEIGDETRDVLLRAQQSAHEITVHAQERAQEVLDEAEGEAEATRISARRAADEAISAAREEAARLYAGAEQQTPPMAQPTDAGRSSGAIQELLKLEFPHSVWGYDREAVDRYRQRVNALIIDFEGSTSSMSAAQRAFEKMSSDTRDTLLRVQDSVQEVSDSARERAQELLAAATSEAEAARASARRETEELLSSARREAEELLSSTRREADVMLSSARREADEMLSASRREAEDMLSAIRREAEDARARAERAGTDAERQRDIEELRGTVQREAAQLRGTARRQADEILSVAEQRARELEDRAEWLVAERQRLIADVRSISDRLGPVTGAEPREHDQ